MTDGTLESADYWSYHVTTAGQSYDTTQCKGLAIFWSELMSHPYFENIRFTIRMDHESLKVILFLPDAAGRFKRWYLNISEFEFDVAHCVGIKSQAADTLSRLQTTGADSSSIQDDSPDGVIDINTWASINVRLEIRRQALAEVVVDNAPSKKGAAPTVAAFMQQQGIDPYWTQAAESTGNSNADYKIVKNGQIVQNHV